MKHVLSDLWETQTYSPFPGLTTHAYLWTPANVLFYSVGTDGDFDELAGLGGVNHQYLSHRDEAGPMLKRIAERFGATLHAAAADLPDITQHAHVDVASSGHQTDANGIEIIPTPGHSPGSVCYVVEGADGRYLLTGDTVFRDTEGRWRAGYIEGFHQSGDAATIADSLRVIAGLAPDYVISSAFQGDSAVHRIENGRWPDDVAQAIAGLPTAART